MYNKTKRGLGLAGAIIGICLGALEVIAGFISFILIAGIMSGAGADYGVEVGTVTAIVLIACLADLAIGIVMIIMGAKLCRHPKQINGVWEKNTGKNVTLIVFMGLMIILYLINEITALRIFMLLVAIAGLTLLIIAMCLKADVSSTASVANPAVETQTQAVDHDIESKISELKRLKELGVITDEQYETAIDKLIKDAIN